MTSIGGIKAGRAFVIIDAIDGTQKVLDRINMRVRRFASNMHRVGQSIFYGASAALIPSGLALVGYAKFDDAMKRVQARTHGTAREMLSLRKQARQLSMDLGYPADQVGELMNKLAQAGYNRKQISDMASPVLMFARAAGEDNEKDAETSANILTSVLQAYELESDKSMYVADLLTTAANASKFSIEELGTALSYSLRPAKDFNISLEDMLALLSQMRNIGIDPSTVGTSSRNIILRLSQPAYRDAFNKNLTKLTGNKINITKLQKLPEIMFEIGESIKNLDELKQAEMISTLFGVRAFTPSLSIIRGENPFRQLKNLFDNSKGVTAKTTGVILEGIGKRFSRFWASLNNTVISVGESLQLAIEATIEKGIELTKQLSAWVEKNPRTVLSIIVLSSAIVGLGIAFQAVAIPLSILTGMFSMLLDVVALLLSPVRLAATILISLSQTLIGVLSGVIGVLIAFGPWTLTLAGVWLIWASNNGILIKSFQELKQKAQSFWGWFVTTVKQVGQALSAAVSVLVTKLGQMLDDTKAILGAVMDSILAGDFEGAMSVGLAGLELLWDETLDAMLATWQTFSEMLREPFAKAIRDVWMLLNELMQKFREAVIEVQYQIKPMLSLGVLVDPSNKTQIQEYESGMKTTRMQRKLADDQAETFYKEFGGRTPEQKDAAEFAKNEREYAIGEKRAAMNARMEALKALHDEQAKARLLGIENPAPNFSGVPSGSATGILQRNGLNSQWDVIDWLQQGTVAAFEKSMKNKQTDTNDPLLDISGKQLTELQKINQTLGDMNEEGL